MCVCVCVCVCVHVCCSVCSAYSVTIVLIGSIESVSLKSCMLSLYNGILIIIAVTVLELAKFHLN